MSSECKKKEKVFSNCPKLLISKDLRRFSPHLRRNSIPSTTLRRYLVDNRHGRLVMYGRTPHRNRYHKIQYQSTVNRCTRSKIFVSFYSPENSGIAIIRKTGTITIAETTISAIWGAASIAVLSD